MLTQFYNNGVVRATKIDVAKSSKNLAFGMVCGSGPDTSAVSRAKMVAFTQVCERMINARGYIYTDILFLYMPIVLNILIDNDQTFKPYCE